MPPPNRKLAEIAAEQDAARRALLEAAEGLDPARLAARPAPDAWSVGEVLDHVARVERSVAGLIRKVLDEGPPLPPAWDDGASVLDAAPPLPTARLEAPPMARPAPGLSREELLAGLERSRRTLREVMDEAAPFDLGARLFPHPVVGPLDLYQWFLFVARHERRHTAQALRARDAVLASADSPPAR